MKLIKGERSELEQSVLKVLMDPGATHTQMDEAMRKLAPRGELRLVSGKDKKDSRPR
jgi:hypothetical protein